MGIVLYIQHSVHWRDCWSYPSSSAEVQHIEWQYTIDPYGLVYAVHVVLYCRRSDCQQWQYKEQHTRQQGQLSCYCISGMEVGLVVGSVCFNIKPTEGEPSWFVLNI